MFRNYLKIALRTFLKEREYSLLNLFGLAVSLAAALFILLFVIDEWSYDRFHERAGRIYRLTETFRNGEEFTTTALTPYALGPLLRETSSAVRNVVRIDNTLGRAFLRYGDARYDETAVVFVDSTFFELFSFPLLQGDPRAVLDQPNTLVIAADKAAQYFGEENPVGKTLRVSAGFGGEPFEVTVTGVMAPMPEQSHFRLDFLISMPTGDVFSPDKIESWGWTSQYTYIELAPGRSIAELEAALPDLQKKHSPEWFQQWASFGAEPLTEIYLRSKVKDEIGPRGDISYLYIFSVVGLFILLVACINYVNLATARATRRAREVGLRKVVGARRPQLILQYLAESYLMVVLAFAAALLLVEAGLPLFNRLTEKSVGSGLLYQPGVLAAVAGALLLVGLLAGAYPALILSSFRPISALRGAMSARGGLGLRRALVVVQFAISIGLIIGMLVVHRQWRFLRHRNLGLETEQMVLLPVQSQKMLLQYPVFKEELLRSPGITRVTAASKDPLDVFTSYNNFTASGQEEDVTLPQASVDEDFFAAYRASILAGRAFEARDGADSSEVAILNESAARLLGLADPVGARVRYSGGEEGLTVIGVVEDFHFESLYSRIRPMIFTPKDENDYVSTITVEIESGRIDQALAAIEAAWNRQGLEEVFSYRFFDEAIDRQYRAEWRFFTVFLVFASLAIGIACLGIFGLSAYATVQRSKEIGVRKVLGATAAQIALLLSGDFLRLVGLAFVLAAPVAYLGIQRWLSNFAYQAGIDPAVFVIAGLTGLAIAWLTVGYNAVKAAGMNPVETLRYE